MLRNAALMLALVTGGLLAAPTAASAGCKITIKVENTLNKDVNVDWEESKVKIQNGLWKKLGTNSQTIPKGQTKSHSYEADFGCNKNRQYKIYWAGGGSDGWIYHPSASTFTKATSFTVKVK